MLKGLKELEDLALKGRKISISVAGAENDSSILSIRHAFGKGFVTPWLVGDKNVISRNAERLGLRIPDEQILHAETPQETAYKAAALVNEKKADCLMKGTIETPLLLKTFLSRDFSLHGKGLLSHITAFEIPRYHKLLFLTDGAMNTAPTMEQKKQILENGISVMKTLGYDKVKVAALSFAEKEDGKTASLQDAGELKRMYEKGLLEEGVILEGPVSFDLAISKASAEKKGYKSPVAGDADLLLMPCLEAANALGKSFTYFGDAKSAGIIVGGAAPILLLSRSDPDSLKYYSILLGVIYSADRRREKADV